MDIPLFFLLIPYVILFSGIFILAIFNMWHMIKFGMFDFGGKLNAVVFIGFSVIIIGMTVVLLLDVPWFDTFTISEIIDFSFGGGSNDISL